MVVFCAHWRTFYSTLHDSVSTRASCTFAWATIPCTFVAARPTPSRFSRWRPRSNKRGSRRRWRGRRTHWSCSCGIETCDLKMCVFYRDQLDSEKRRREAIEKEKEQMEREKQELMTKLYQFEETTKRAERGETHHIITSKLHHCSANKKGSLQLMFPKLYLNKYFKPVQKVCCPLLSVCPHTQNKSRFYSLIF